MKSKANPLVILFFILFGFAAAQTVSESLKRIQSDVSTGDVTAFFEKSIVVDGVTYSQPWESVSWNAGGKQVTVSGQTLTYSQVMQFVVAIAAQERAAQIAAQSQPSP